MTDIESKGYLLKNMFILQINNYDIDNNSNVTATVKFSVEETSSISTMTYFTVGHILLIEWLTDMKKSGDLKTVKAAVSIVINRYIYSFYCCLSIFIDVYVYLYL